MPSCDDLRLRRICSPHTTHGAKQLQIKIKKVGRKTEEEGFPKCSAHTYPGILFLPLHKNRELWWYSQAINLEFSASRHKVSRFVPLLDHEEDFCILI